MKSNSIILYQSQFCCCIIYILVVPEVKPIVTVHHSCHAVRPRVWTSCFILKSDPICPSSVPLLLFVRLLCPVSQSVPVCLYLCFHLALFCLSLRVPASLWFDFLRTLDSCGRLLWICLAASWTSGSDLGLPQTHSMSGSFTLLSSSGLVLNRKSSDCAFYFIFQIRSSHFES